MMRVQNDRNFQDLNSGDSALFDVSTLFHPSRNIDATKEDLDKISRYLNDEVNFIMHTIFLICFKLKIFCRKLFWKNLSPMKKF